MSILATIGAICSAVVSVCTTIAAVCKVAESVVSLGKAVGLIQTKETQEQIGVRCLAAEEQGVTPGAFNHDYNAYMKAVNEMDISNVDPERWTKEEKALKAIEVASGALIHEFNPNAEKLLLAQANHPESSFFTTERMNVMLNEAEKQNIDLPNALDYIEGKDASAKEARQDLAMLEQMLSPEISEQEALDRVDVERGKLS